MNEKALLCLDSQTLLHPFLIGLPDENLEQQSWLGLCCDAEKARFAVFSNKDLKVVWVVSSDTVAGINLAAALRKDNPYVDVYYVSFNLSGSVISRCRAASVKPLDKTGFMKAYSSLKTIKGSKCGLENDLVQKRDLSSNAGDGKPSMEESGVVARDIQKSEETRLSSPSDVQKDEFDLDESPHLFVGSQSRGDKERAKRNTLSIQQGPSEKNLRSCFDDPHNTLASAADNSRRNSALSRALHREAKGCAISVFSGSGGSGKSSVAAMLGLASVSLGFKTVILDADFQFGDMAFLLGLNDSLTAQDLIETPERVHEISEQEALPSLVASPKNLEYSEVANKNIADLVVLLKNKYEVVIVNTGAFWGDHHAQLLEISDRSLFLIDQRPSSVRSCSHALSLCSRCGIAAQNFVFALNGCSRQSLLTSIDVSCALKGVHVFEFKDGGKEVGELLAAGLPKELVRDKNAFYESVKAFAQEVIPFKADQQREVPLSGKQKNFRLVRRKRRAACL